MDVTHLLKRDAKGRPYGGWPGSQTPTDLVVYISSVQTNYIDEFGVEHFVEIPEGHVKADHLYWNAQKDEVLKWVDTLPEGRRYKVCILECDW